jgi:cell division protease FtsH
MQVPSQDRFLMKKNKTAQLYWDLLGGHAAKEIIFGDISTGVDNDLAKVTDIARSRVGNME